MITNIELVVCRRCDGDGVLLFAGGRVTGPCPGCCCHYCGKTTTTPPECEGGCDVLEDSVQERRADV